MGSFILLSSVTIITAYILGSINGAIITSKVFYRKDIRDYGSGNAGLTNFYRVFRTGATLIVILIDVLKTVIPVLLGGYLFSSRLDMAFTPLWINENIISPVLFGQSLAGLAVVFGHCFPVFYKFKGGKGIMALGCIVFVIDWQLALIAWAVFIVIALITRYVSLGSVIGSITFPVSMIFLGYKGEDVAGTIEFCIVALFILLIVIRHARNIKRIAKGEESKLEFGRSSKKEER